MSMAALQRWIGSLHVGQLLMLVVLAPLAGFALGLWGLSAVNDARSARAAITTNEYRENPAIVTIAGVDMRLRRLRDTARVRRLSAFADSLKDVGSYHYSQLPADLKRAGFADEVDFVRPLSELESDSAMLIPGRVSLFVALLLTLAPVFLLWVWFGTRRRPV